MASIIIISGEKALRPYLSEVAIYEARTETEKMFTKVTNKKILPAWSEDYAWSLHDIFFYQVVSPYLELKPLIELASTGKKIICTDLPGRYSSILKQFAGFEIKQKRNLKTLCHPILSIFFNFFLLSYSFMSFLWCLPRKKIIGLWTGDYYHPQTHGDPRIADIYFYLKKENLSYLEFIRTTGVSPRKTISNMIKRKHPAIYQDSVENLFKPKNKNPLIPLNQSSEKHLEHLLTNLADQCLMYQKSSIIFNFIFKMLNLKCLLCWFLSHRTYSIVAAAKKQKIKTIGFMHGVSVYSYMGHEYMPEYRGPPLGPDKYGVWSDYWLKEFQERSSIYHPHALEVSGPINKNIFYDKNSSSKEYITIISEQSSEPKYIIHYIEFLLSQNEKIILKVRPFGEDRFYQNFKQFYPEILKQIKVSFSPIEEVFNQSSLVLGTHSTAVIEASKYLVPFAILSTTKWQDYFSIQKTSSPYKNYIKNNEDLLELLSSIKKNDFSPYLKLIRTNYFGDKIGLDWIKKEINQS